MINTDLQAFLPDLKEVENLFTNDGLNIRHRFKRAENKFVNTLTINGQTYAYGNIVPKNLTEIEANTFEKCKKITEIVFPDSIETIKSGAFRDCGRLSTIYFGHGLSEIESLSFLDCNKIEKVYYNGTEDEWKNIIVDDKLIYHNDIYLNTKQPY